MTKRPTDNYFECEGKPLGERNPKWLNDDYVKFMRFGQWRIEQTGHGILAFVTNHGYLDNPTFRGMRESLLKGFNEIYLLDLHGNSKKRERAPDGSEDKNVFDIQQGVAIGIFVRKQDGHPRDKKLANIFHADLYGTRQHKYTTLDDIDISDTKWRELKPTSPNYYFVPEDGTLSTEYMQGWKITDAMPIHSLGIATARDALTVQLSKNEIWNVVQDFASQPAEEARQKYNLGKDARDWKVHLAQRDLQDSGPSQSQLTEVLYRPFDVRYTYYTGNSRGFHCMPRANIMDHFFGHENLALSITRNIEIERGFEHVFVSTYITTLHTTSIKEVNYHIPLWLYPRRDDDLFEAREGKRKVNFAPKFTAELTKVIGTKPSSIDRFAYIYAIFNTPSFRLRYAEFLRRDFPRIPITSNKHLFGTLVEIGLEMISLHTMKAVLPRIIRYEVAGTNEVIKVHWSQENCGRVHINHAQYFEGVSKSIWEMHVGGYRIAERWLKDRKGRKLTYDDLTHYQAIIASLARTLELQNALDNAIDVAGGWPLS